MALTLIDKTIVNGTDVYFYEGIDFDMISRHTCDQGFLIFFVDSYVSAAKAWERQSRIDSLLDGRDPERFDSEKYQNDHIAIYQTSGNTMPVYEAIREKLIGPLGCWHPTAKKRINSDPEFNI